MPTRSDYDDTTFRRKKARRSCLHCQRSHRTCSNERPCMECERRGLTKTCVDGDRKIPKYLYDMSEKSAEIDLSHDRAHSNAPTHSLNSGAISSKAVDEFGATFEKQMDLSQKSSTEQDPGGFIESAILHIESPIFLPSRRIAKSHTRAAENPEAQSSKVARSSFLALPVGLHDNHPLGNTLNGKTIGFTISSGWSSTFLPCEMTEEPGRT